MQRAAECALSRRSPWIAVLHTKRCVHDVVADAARQPDDATRTIRRLDRVHVAIISQVNVGGPSKTLWVCSASTYWRIIVAWIKSQLQIMVPHEARQAHPPSDSLINTVERSERSILRWRRRQHIVIGKERAPTADWASMTIRAEV